MLSTEICLKILDLAVEDDDYATQKAFYLRNLCLSHELRTHMEKRLYRKIWLEDTVTANLLIEALRTDLARSNHVQKIDLAVGSLSGAELVADRQAKEAAFREFVHYCQPKEFRMVVRYDSFKPASILRKVCHQRLESLTIHALAEGREDRYDESPFITASGELIDKALDQLKCLVIGGLAIVGFTCVNLNYRCRTPKLRELQFLDCYSPPELINREGAIQAAIYCQRLCRLNKASLRVLNLSGMHHFLAIHGYHWTWISQLCQFHELRHLTLGTHRRAFFLAPNVTSAIWNMPALERLDFHYDTQPEDAGQLLPTLSEGDFVLDSLEVAMPGRQIQTSIRIISIMCEHRNMPISSTLFKDKSKEHRRRMQRWLKSIKAEYLERGILLEA